MRGQGWKAWRLKMAGWGLGWRRGAGGMEEGPYLLRSGSLRMGGGVLSEKEAPRSVNICV